MKTTLFVCFIVFVSAISIAAAPAAPASPGVAITVYNDNFAVVKERRQMDFEKGVNTLKFPDVAAQIDPTSVNFLCLSNPAAVGILEQNFEYDLVGIDSLMKKYIDSELTVFVRGSGASANSICTGILLSYDGANLILQGPGHGPLTVINAGSVERIELAKKPDELLTRPTLVWLANAADKGQQLCQVAYMTNGIQWKADYSAVLNEKEDHIDMTGWVTIENRSGAAYKDATLKLVAGDVRREQPPMPRPQGRMKAMEFAMAADSAGFEEKAFMEYHLYTLGRKSTLQNNQVKQIELIAPARDVAVKKIYLFETALEEWQIRNNKKVQVKIEFDNKKENQLGIALPKGKVRVFKKDPADDSLEFVGEDTIDHTPKDEKLSLYIGDAFDVVAEQTMTDARNGDRFHIFTRKVEIRNRKEEAVDVFVDEKIPQYRNWKVDRSTHPETKKDAYTARFTVPVEAGKTATLEYQMTQTW